MLLLISKITYILLIISKIIFLLLIIGKIMHIIDQWKKLYRLLIIGNHIYSTDY
jgi:hypothetical protein